jgi:hypothetical protein
MNCKAIAGMLIAALALTACGGAEPESDTFQDATARRGVPQAALDFEAQSEDAYDTALKGDLAGVRTAAASINALWKKLRKIVVRDGLRTSSVQALDKSVSRLSSLSAASTDGVKLARAANAVSGTMDDVFELYHPKVPPTILTLDYLGREMVLDCKENALHSASVHLKALKAEWAGLRPQVLAVGGRKEAAQLDAALSAAEKAISSRDWAGIEKQAQAELELVDAMEHDLHW